jgi:hypothetical protein
VVIDPLLLQPATTEPRRPQPQPQPKPQTQKPEQQQRKRKQEHKKQQGRERSGEENEDGVRLRLGPDSDIGLNFGLVSEADYAAAAAESKGECHVIFLTYARDMTYRRSLTAAGSSRSLVAQLVDYSPFTWSCLHRCPDTHSVHAPRTTRFDQRLCDSRLVQARAARPPHGATWLPEAGVAMDAGARVRQRAWRAFHAATSPRMGAACFCRRAAALRPPEHGLGRSRLPSRASFHYRYWKGEHLRRLSVRR